MRQTSCAGWNKVVSILKSTGHKWPSSLTVGTLQLDSIYFPVPNIWFWSSCWFSVAAPWNRFWLVLLSGIWCSGPADGSSRDTSSMPSWPRPFPASSTNPTSCRSSRWRVAFLFPVRHETDEKSIYTEAARPDWKEAWFILGPIIYIVAECKGETTR